MTDSKQPPILIRILLVVTLVYPAVEAVSDAKASGTLWDAFLAFCWVVGALYMVLISINLAALAIKGILGGILWGIQALLTSFAT